jgi:hypothetical protein
LQPIVATFFVATLSEMVLSLMPFLLEAEPSEMVPTLAEMVSMLTFLLELELATFGPS